MALLQRFVGGVIADALRESVMGVDAGIRIPQSRKKDKSPKGSRDLRQRVTPEVGSGTAIEGFLAVPLARHRLHGLALDCTIKSASSALFQACSELPSPAFGGIRLFSPKFRRSRSGPRIFLRNPPLKGN